MKQTTKQKIDRYLNENVGESADWTEYEKHKMAIFSIVNSHPEEFEYAMTEIVRRMAI